MEKQDANRRPLKYIVQSVYLLENSDGEILGEDVGEPTVYYGVDALIAFGQSEQSQGEG